MFWIWTKNELLYREAVVPGAAQITDVILGPDGLIYGLASGSAFFVFDPESREIVHFEKKTALWRSGWTAGPQDPGDGT